MSTAAYVVRGMSCEHCVASVTEEVEEIDGVTTVDVDLGSGALSVTSDREVAEAEVRVAVEAAGYDLV